jgi:hypothetical protein
MLLVGAYSCRGLIIIPDRLRPREEIHLDLADKAAAELDVAGSRTAIFHRLAWSLDLGDQCCSYRLGCPFRKNARLGRAGICAVAHCVDFRVRSTSNSRTFSNVSPFRKGGQLAR